MFNLFISGVEPDNYFEMVAKEGKNHMLMSYFHCMRKGKKFLEERFAKYPDVTLMIDSGAFTFLNNPDIEEEARRYKEKHNKDYWENYIEIYVNWLRKHRAHIFSAVELDIGAIVGKAKVEEWRRKYFEPLEKEGIQIIYVWHGAEGIGEWERLCKEHNYVALSFKDEVAANADMGKLFAIAKKHHAKIHGLAVTGGAMLMTYPWATCDSSTWLVGTQYGEVNFFEGRKLTRLKKDKWKKQYKNKLIHMGANWALMEREDPYELQRVCLLAFLEMEKYVKKIMRSKWYWSDNPVAKKKLVLKKKPENISREVINEETPVEELVSEVLGTDYPRGLLPTKDWFDGDCDQWEKYAAAVGLDISDGKDITISALQKFYDFENDNLDDYSTEEIYDLCDLWGIPKGDINTRSKAIPILKECFHDHAIGKRSDFSGGDAAVAEAKERAKDREEYVIDDDYVTVEVTKKECDVFLSGFLPEAGMPEVDAYDAELKKSNIEVFRDVNGRFLKGQRKVLKPKKLYSNKLPQVACDSCQVAADCPDYRAGFVCAYNKMFKKFDTRNYDDLVDAMHEIVSENIGRMQRMMMMEKINGGIVDATVDKLMDMNMKYLAQMKELTSPNSGKVMAQQKTVINEDGSSETITTVSASPTNPQAGGVLSQLFNNASIMNIKDDIIDVTPEKEENEDAV